MTARPRRKAPKLEVPQTIEEATALLGYYSDALTYAERLRAEADASIAAIQAERDERLKPLEERMKDIFRQLRAWWAVAGPAITEGKRKSVEIAGCVIGERTTPPSLKLPRGVDADELIAILEDLSERAGEVFVNVKKSVNKPACISALRRPVGWLQEALICDAGLSVVQNEEFFIDRAAEKPVQVEQVAEAAE